ncbi:type VI secretion system baseplate subunit TssK [Aquincola sp. MAHUQ-54]|uniref:Type VI secretion system baseplate subunit TssK n=1 Tax=Aquincola agrisoli TaxID=3119538 RepID=A0AAW9Q5Y2_9BURK
MGRLFKPLWNEGVFLGPEHFQQQDRYVEARVCDAARLGSVAPWGVHAVEIDPDGLALGQLHVLRLKVTFPDGETFDSDGADRVPPGRQLADAVPAAAAEACVYAALPPFDGRAANYRLQDAEGARARRYYREFEDVVDVVSGHAGAQLAVSRRNVTLMLDGEPLGDYQVCPIALLRRDSSGVLRVARDFVPPSVALGASEYLLHLLRRLHDMLQAKSQALSEQRRERSSQLVEFGAADVSLFWLLHTVNTAWPEVRHLMQHPAAHPERAFAVLSRLAAALMTFAPDTGLEELPSYRHAEPAEHFRRLDALLRRLLDTVIPSRFVPLPLEPVRPALHYGRLDNDELIGKADFYLSVHAALPAQQLVELATRVIKVGSPDDVDRLVNSALPGVGLIHMARVPSALPVKMGRHYFGLLADGPQFQRMLQSRTIAVYVPRALPEAAVELMAVMR